MNLLVLGGTRFVGYHLVAEARGRGHAVSVFNRGQTRAEPLPGVENIRGDRDGGLAALGDRRWDAVVDTSGYFPRLVRDSARYLAPLVDKYLFISTISVYADFSRPGLTEDAELATTDDPASEELGGEAYGALKALCEAEVAAALPGRALVVRPGLIVGPQDPTDRFTYWPLRVARGGEVLAPGRPDYPAQFIDVRDLAGWCLDLLADGVTGTYHVTGPVGGTTLGELLAAGQSVGGGPGTEISWVPEGFLLEQGVGPWSDLPMWLPEDQIGLMAVDIGRAVALGLRTRPIKDTVRDTLIWARGRGEVELRAGLSPEREAELLAAWRQAGLSGGADREKQ